MMQVSPTHDCYQLVGAAVTNSNKVVGKINISF